MVWSKIQILLLICLTFKFIQVMLNLVSSVEVEQTTIFVSEMMFCFRSFVF